MLTFITHGLAVGATYMKNDNLYFQQPQTVGENPQEANRPNPTVAGDSQWQRREIIF